MDETSPMMRGEGGKRARSEAGRIWVRRLRLLRTVALGGKVEVENVVMRGGAGVWRPFVGPIPHCCQLCTFNNCDILPATQPTNRCMTHYPSFASGFAWETGM